MPYMWIWQIKLKILSKRIYNLNAIQFMVLLV